MGLCRLGVLRRAKAVGSDLPIAVALAKNEWENWFLAASPSLADRNGLPMDLTAPTDPEAQRGVKEWLGVRMKERYQESVHQPAFTALFDLDQARRADSFDRCCREIQRLLGTLAQPAPD